MLSPELSTGMAIVALAISVVSFIGCYSAVTFAARMAREKRDYRALLLFLTELEDNHAALADSHKRLRSRVGMQELRKKRKAAQNGDDTEPDQGDAITAETEKEKWKREMRVKLHAGQLAK